jgi:hypothetical protein
VRDPFDRRSKWLIGHHGSAVLRLGGVERIRSWRALQAEVTHPRQLPDGLLEVYFADTTDSDLFLIETVTYPDQRVREQLVRDVAVVLLDRRVLPEVLTVVLRPRGNVEVGSEEEMQSRLGWTGLRINWRVVKLWTLPAEQLLAANDVGLVPWVPLTQFASSPEVVLQECRRRIDTQASAEERANLLAVTQVMTRLRYNDPQLVALFGGKQAMIDSPLIQELLAERDQKAILRVLSRRFGSIPPEIILALTPIQDEARLNDLIDCATGCPNLEAFRARLT